LPETVEWGRVTVSMPRSRARDTLREDELSQIVSFGRDILEEGKISGARFASRIGAVQYIRIANEVSSYLPEGEILDWGCGYGQVSYLLARRGLAVQGVEPRSTSMALAKKINKALRVRLQLIVPGERLPFDDATFDAALSCGVLEHVDDPAESLRQIVRILKPNGWFFVYHLPNRFALTESAAAALGRHCHERTYSRPAAVRLLRSQGFEVLSCEPFHFLPRNLLAGARTLAAIVDRLAWLHELADLGLSHAPLIQEFSTAWKLIARKR